MYTLDLLIFKQSKEPVLTIYMNKSPIFIGIVTAAQNLVQIEKKLKESSYLYISLSLHLQNLKVVVACDKKLYYPAFHIQKVLYVIH